MAPRTSDSWCPICGSEHLVAKENQSSRPSSPPNHGSDSTSQELKQTTQPHGTRQPWHPSARCPLPSHVLDCKVLIADHNDIHRLIMQRILGKMGIASDQAANPGEALSMYQDDLTKYTVVCIDPMIFQAPIKGLDVMRRIREYERQHNIPPCLLIGMDCSRIVTIGRSVTRQMVMDCGVDLILPWYRYELPLYDALAGIPEPSRHDESGIVAKINVDETNGQEEDS